MTKIQISSAVKFVTIVAANVAVAVAADVIAHKIIEKLDK